MSAVLNRPQSRGLSRGVAVSWIAQLIQIGSGFIVPRIIDTDLGMEALGVWDLGWSLISYLMLLEAGIGSSVNRHVALYRAESALGAVNTVVSSVAIVQRSLGVIILGFTAFLAWMIPSFANTSDLGLALQARWMVALLGASVAVSFSGAVYTGVLTGCHGWVAHHSVYAVCNVFSFVGMVGVLRADSGISALAFVHLVTELFGRIARVVLAHRACPGLKISLRHARIDTVRKMVGFGGRMFVGRMSAVIMVHSINLLISSHLGPATLALFVRPRSLIRQAAVFPQKYAFMLVPKAAEYSNSLNGEEFRRFAVTSTRWGLYMSLPLIVLLLIDGDLLMHVWMGARYASAPLIIIQTLAFAGEIVYQPLNNVLMGLNLHGRPAFVALGTALIAVFLSYVALSAGASLSVVAAATLVSWGAGHAIYTPVYACRRLGFPLRTFLRETWLRPVACIVPFALSLGAGRVIFQSQPIHALIIGGSLGGAALAVCYWLWVLPDSARSMIRKQIARVSPFGQVAASTQEAATNSDSSGRIE